MNTQLNTALDNALNTENDFSTPINKLNTMNTINNDQQQLQQQQLLQQLQHEQQIQQQLQQQQLKLQQQQQQLPIQYNPNFFKQTPLEQQIQQMDMLKKSQQIPPVSPTLVPQNTPQISSINNKMYSRQDVLAELDEINNSPVLLPNSNKIKNNLFKYIIENSYCEIIACVLFFLLNSQFIICILSKYFSKFDNNENPSYSLILRSILFSVLFILLTKFIKNKFIR